MHENVIPLSAIFTIWTHFSCPKFRNYVSQHSGISVSTLDFTNWWFHRDVNSARKGSTRSQQQQQRNFGIDKNPEFRNCNSLGVCCPLSSAFLLGTFRIIRNAFGERLNILWFDKCGTEIGKRLLLYYFYNAFVIRTIEIYVKITVDILPVVTSIIL